MHLHCNSYYVYITVAVCMFQVASNSSVDIPDENSNNSLSSKWACQLCRENGVKRPSRRAIETCFGCLICNVHLYKMGFFVQYHAWEEYFLVWSQQLVMLLQ